MFFSFVWKQTLITWNGPSSRTAPIHPNYTMCDRWGVCQREPWHEKLGLRRDRFWVHSFIADVIYDVCVPLCKQHFSVRPCKHFLIPELSRECWFIFEPSHLGHDWDIHIQRTAHTTTNPLSHTHTHAHTMTHMHAQFTNHIPESQWWALMKFRWIRWGMWLQAKLQIWAAALRLKQHRKGVTAQYFPLCHVQLLVALSQVAHILRY